MLLAISIPAKDSTKNTNLKKKTKKFKQNLP